MGLLRKAHARKAFRVSSGQPCALSGWCQVFDFGGAAIMLNALPADSFVLSIIRVFRSTIARSAAAIAFAALYSYLVSTIPI